MKNHLGRLSYILVPLFILAVVFFFIFSDVPSNQNGAIQVRDGDQVIITADQSVPVYVYTEEGTQTTSLSDYTGHVVLATETDHRPGYYSGSATIMPGSYTVLGNSAILVVDSNLTASVTNPKFEAELRSTFHSAGIFLYTFFALLWLVISISSYRSSISESPSS